MMARAGPIRRGKSRPDCRGCRLGGAFIWWWRGRSGCGSFCCGGCRTGLHERAGFAHPHWVHGGHRRLRRVAHAGAARSERLLEGGPDGGLGDDRHFGDGHAGQRDHIYFDAGPGVSRRAGVRAKLLRAAAGAHSHRRRVPADLPAVEGLYGLRVSRTAV